MAGHEKTQAWDKGFFAAIVSSLKDVRLWFLLLPSLLICGLILALVKSPWVAGSISFGLALIVTYLISKIETFPTPDRSELAEGFYRKMLLPVATGILIIPNMGLFVDLWATQWHWFHADGSIPPCSYIWTLGLLGWLGLLVAPTLVALLVKERAVFATMAGLMVYVPISVTRLVTGGDLQKATSLWVKSCQIDTADFDHDAFGAGVVFAILSQVLVAIFVAKVVSTWRSRKNAPLP
jgi:hypothetical protein